MADALPPIEELPGDLRLIADVIGVGPAWQLAKAFGGTMLYIVKVDAFARRHRDATMRDEFDRRTGSGESTTVVVRDMARRESLSERQVWNIVGAPDDRQTRMF